jgi:hypothetical protein
MSRIFASAVIGLILLLPLRAQVQYLDRPDLMALSDSCLRHTYGFSFQKARSFQQKLDRLTPSHPAPPFLEALILYWEHFPLLPSDPETDQFVDLMDKTVERAADLISAGDSRVEGIFFDLFGRAFKAMFWADNGKVAKAASDLRTMYRYTKEGFELKESLVEFYFSTGLYNYYIEAYPEAHPVYKPLVAFMHEGDRDMGLVQLHYAIENAVFLRVEAMLFMSLIQLNYENDMKTALGFAKRMHREYPGNIYYQGHLMGILLHQHRFSQAEKVLSLMERQNDPYSKMVRTLAYSFLYEFVEKDDLKAGRGYQDLLEQSEALGPIADNFRAMAYMGLSRLHYRKDLGPAARRNARKAASYTAYSFILDEKADGQD